MDPAVHATPHPFPLRANAPLAKATSVKNTSLCALITLQGCEVVLWLLPMHPRAIRVLHTSSPWTAQFRRSHGQEAVLESARRLSRSPFGSVWEGEVTRATGRAPPCRDPLPHWRYIRLLCFPKAAPVGRLFIYVGLIAQGGFGRASVRGYVGRDFIERFSDHLGFAAFSILLARHCRIPHVTGAGAG